MGDEIVSTEYVLHGQIEIVEVEAQWIAFRLNGVVLEFSIRVKLVLGYLSNERNSKQSTCLLFYTVQLSWRQLSQNLGKIYSWIWKNQQDSNEVSFDFFVFPYFSTLKEITSLNKWVSWQLPAMFSQAKKEKNCFYFQVF